MNRDSRRIRGARFTLVLSAALFLFVWVPAVAGAAPQEPWVLPAVNLSGTGENAVTPAIATGPDGTTAAIWTRFDGTQYVAQASIRPPGGTFGAPVGVSATGQNTVTPDVTVGPDGAIAAIWARFDGTHYIVQASIRPPGGTFGAPVDLSATGRDANKPQITIGPDGTATAVWYRYNGADYTVEASTRPPGGAFGLPAALSTPGLNAFDPEIAVGADGTTTAVWWSTDNTHSFVQASTRPAGGGFGAPADLSAADRNASLPQIAAGPDGTATAVWSIFDGTDSIIQAATRPPGGTFGGPVDLSATGQNAVTPQIAIGPDGGTTAGWSRFDGANYTVQAATRPPGGIYGAPLNLSGSGRDAFDPRIAITPDRSVTAIWERSNGANSIIQATLRPPGGDFTLPVDLSATGQDATGPRLATGPDGSATAIWVRFDGTSYIVQEASTARPSPQLSVTRSGPGRGRVRSNPAGIECGKVCSKEYLSYTKVTLTAAAGTGSRFAGWHGACSGTTRTCKVTMLDAVSVNARFAPQCNAATLRTDGYRANRRNGTGTLKVKVGAAGKVTLTGSRTVHKAAKRIRHRGTVRLRVRAKGPAARKLRRTGSVRVKLRLTFRPGNRCPAKTRTLTVKLVK